MMLRRIAVLSRMFIPILALAAPVASQARRFVDLPLDSQSALWVRGHEGDTLLADPNRVAVVGSMLVLTDPVGPSVTALDTGNGRVLWRYARRGTGPGEMREPAMVVPFGPGLLVADNQTRRFYVLDTRGRFVREAAVPKGHFVAGLCPIRSGMVVMHYAALQGSRLALIEVDSGRQRDLPALFPGPARDPNEGVFDLSAAGNNQCIATRKTASGMVVFAVDGAARRGEFVERIRQRPYVPVAQIRDTSQLPIPFSLSSATSGNRVYVWFGGSTSCRFRCIDVYSLQSLDYLYTIRFTGRLGINLRHVAISDGRIYLLGMREDVPVVAAYRLPSPPSL